MDAEHHRRPDLQHLQQAPVPLGNLSLQAGMLRRVEFQPLAGAQHQLDLDDRPFLAHIPSLATGHPPVDISGQCTPGRQ